MKIPPEVQIHATIQPGAVYYFVEETLYSRAPHYFIVLNHHPAEDEVILLVCASSRIQETKTRAKRRSLPDSTLVEIQRDEYPDFTTDSIVDCNYVLHRSIEHLVNKLKQGNLQLKSVMKSSLVEKLRKGMLDSPIVKENIKTKYLR